MVRKLLIYTPLIFILFLGIYFIVKTSWYVRYWVDDFCSSVFLRNNGFWGSQVAWYKSWTGRYSAIFFTNIFETIGPWVVRVLPILIFISFSLTFYLMPRNLLLSASFAILLLVNAPNIIQSFYWQTGSLNYTLGFVFLNLFIYGVLNSALRNKLWFAFLIAFVTGGFSEAFALGSLPFIFGLFAIILIFNPKGKKEMLRFLFFGVLGLFTSLFIMYLSPGNFVRGQTVTKPDSLIFVVKFTLLATKWYLLRMFSINTFLYSLGIIFCLVFIFEDRLKTDVRRGIVGVLVSVLSGVFGVMMVIFSGFYAMSILPPERTLFVAVSLFLYSFVLFSLFLSSIINFYFRAFRERFLFVIAFVNILFSILLLFSIVSHWKNIYEEVSSYAKSWDVEVGNLPVIKNIKPVGGLDSFTDNKGWVSACIAGYYGFERIEVK